MSMTITGQACQGSAIAANEFDFEGALAALTRLAMQGGAKQIDQAGATIQRVNSASSSKPSAHSLPQKRRTLSSGFSQYQHDPFGGRLWRGRSGGNGGATVASASVSVSLSGKLSCTVPKIPPFAQQQA